MNLVRKIQNAPYAVMAAVSLAVMDAMPAAAQSSTTVGEAAKTVTKQISDVGKLAVTGAFLGGVVMVASGLMKLKQAADTQGQQVKYGEGLFRLAVGAGLVAVPAVTGMLTQSIGWGGVNIQQSNGF